MSTPSTVTYPQAVEIHPDDLPLHCPNPTMNTKSWHPRVFLQIETTGKAMCPYCGTRYTLVAPPNPDHHHP
jgi:uncharacterized Zn-finger protein